MFYHCDKLPCRRQESTWTDNIQSGPEFTICLVASCAVHLLNVQFGNTKTSSPTAQSDPGFLNGNHGRWCHKGRLLYPASTPWYHQSCWSNIIHHIGLMLVWMGTTCFKLTYTLFIIIQQHQTQGVQTDQRQCWGIVRRYWTNIMVDPLRRAGR